MRIDQTRRAGLMDSEDYLTFIDSFSINPEDGSDSNYLIWREYQKNDSLAAIQESSDFWEYEIDHIQKMLINLTPQFEACISQKEKDTLIYNNFSCYGIIHIVKNRGLEDETHLRLSSKGFLCRSEVIRQPADKNALTPKIGDRYPDPDPYLCNIM